MNYTHKIFSAALLVAIAVVGIGASAFAQTSGLSFACLPGSQSIGLNQTANFAVVGGNGTYTFSGAGLTTVTTTSTVFSAAFSASGAQTVTVTSGGQAATCVVNVSASSTPAPVQCNAPSAVVSGQAATFVATGGNGSYVWSATNATISDPNGPVLRLTYSATGPQTVTVTSNGQSSACSVNVVAASPATPLSCSPSSQTVQVGEAATFMASGGTGVYSWFGAGLNLVSPTGPVFNVTYSVPISGHAIIVTSGSQTATCTANAVAATTIPGLPNTGYAPASH